MYESFFGLKTEPFSVAPDPRFLYLSQQHRDALSHLANGLRHAGGFVLLTGEVGAGKTTVWRRFLEQLPWNFDVAYVVNPKLGVDALLARICSDLHVEQTEGAAAKDPIDAIHGHLLLAHARGRRTLIVVDEAQALSLEVMEQLRLLTNLVVTTERKLVQVLLIGQPELRTMLEQPALEPLAQRVVARFHLPALPESETAHYIAHRLTVAGLLGELPFDAEAMQRIHHICRGVPRRINVLCDRALVVACTAGSRRVDRSIVDRAAADVFGPATPAVTPAAAASAPAWRAWLAAGGVAGGVLAAWVVLTPLVLGGRSASETSERGVASVVAAPVPAAAAVRPPPPPVAGGAVSSAVVASAPAATAPVTPAPPPADALDPVFAAAPSDEAAALRALAGLWGASLGPGDACELAAKRALYCYRSRGGLAPIRQLGRPGIVKLQDQSGRVAQVQLRGLSEEGAILRVGNLQTTVPLNQLAQVWRGEFTTLWRAPPGYRAGDLAGTEIALAPWLRERLDAIEPAAATPDRNQDLKARVFAFQLAQGLQPDGLAGPLTLMQLNRASGVEEPRLVVR
ncbi:MAG: AAA family ATPase [Burkholderiaceae bacterium]|nr:AAA family ATPase [Burkholderiaceae bacterium]